MHDDLEYDLTGKQVIVADVPCGDCHACCQNDLIFLHPECGDIIADYEHEPAPPPFKGRLVLRHNSNGQCVYLGVEGCGIHGNAPAICREFDCRRFAASLGYTKARKMMKRGMVSHKVINMGRNLSRKG